MPEFAKYLPFSQRPAVDESAAGSDWSAPLAETLTVIADLLAGLSPEQWDAPSLCGEWRVRDVAGHLVWRLGHTNMDLVRSLGRAMLDGRFLNPNRGIDMVSRTAAEADPAELVAALRRIAGDRMAGHGHHGVTELTEAVVHGFDIARALDLTLPVAPTVTGAVALRRALIAPTPIKAVLRRRTLVATDALWRVGRGLAFEGTAEDIVLFLFGREGFTPGGRRTTA